MPDPIKALLLPGLDGSGQFFDHFVQATTEFINPDIVTYPSGGDQSYKTLTQFALQKFKDSGARIIIAESFSGPIAIRLAAQKPEGLQAIVLASTFIKNPLPFKAAFGVLTGLAQKLPGQSLAIDFMLTNNRISYGEKVMRVIKALPADTLTSRMRAALNENCADQYKGIDIPVLVLTGSKDRLFPQSGFKAFELNDRARIVQIDGPHFLLQCNAEEAAGNVRSFLHDLTPR